MSVVGAFPGWKEINRRTNRAPVNPFDKATVCSIFPFYIEERKYTLDPGTFKIPAGSVHSPVCVPVGPSSWWREIDPEQPLLEIPVASVLIADSIVRDYCNGLIGCNMGDCMPGLFFLPGEITVLKLKTEFKHLLDAAEIKQKKWFNELVTIADVAWARTNGNPLTINEMMKRAAHELGLDDREWLKSYHATEMIRCFACGTVKDPKFPVCPACRAIDPTHEKAKDIKFAV